MIFNQRHLNWNPFFANIMAVKNFNELHTTREISIVYLYQVLVILTPILDNYLLVPVQFLYIVCALGFFLFIYMSIGDQIQITARAWIYAVYVLIFLLIYTFPNKDVAFSSLIHRAGYFVLIFINFYVFAYQVWDFDRCFDLYKKICFIVSALIVIQFLLGHLGLGFSLIPPGLTTNTVERFSTGFYRAKQVSERRFSTFFLEPAHQAQYCMPCLAMVLFSGFNTTKKTIIPAVIITVGLLATTSMQGILGAGVIWFMYLHVMIKEEKIKGFGRTLILLPLIAIAVFFIWSQPVLQEQFQKKILSFNRGNIYRGTSLYVRMFYGWDCFKELGILQKVLLSFFKQLTSGQILILLYFSHLALACVQNSH